MKVALGELEVWFVTGSQHLYGEEALRQVEAHSKGDGTGSRRSRGDPGSGCVQAGADQLRGNSCTVLGGQCRSKLYRVGYLDAYFLTGSHVDHRDCEVCTNPLFISIRNIIGRSPGDEIDMDFVNLNQSAHGCREFGYIASRLRLERKVIVGHWQDPRVLAELGTWTRAAAAWHDAQGAKIARFGDNMRQVAVTEGDKVEAEIQLGYSVNGYGIGDLVAYINEIADSEVDQLLAIYGGAVPTG